MEKNFLRVLCVGFMLFFGAGYLFAVECEKVFELEMNHKVTKAAWEDYERVNGTSAAKLKRFFILLGHCQKFADITNNEECQLAAIEWAAEFDRERDLCDAKCKATNKFRKVKYTDLSRCKAERAAKLAEGQAEIAAELPVVKVQDVTAVKDGADDL